MVDGDKVAMTNDILGEVAHKMDHHDNDMIFCEVEALNGDGGADR